MTDLQVQEKVTTAVQALPPWVHIVVLLLLGGGGATVPPAIYNDIFGPDREEVQLQVQTQLQEAQRPLLASMDSLTTSVNSLTQSLDRQQELAAYNQCQIRALNDGIDIDTCNEPPDFSR